MIAHQGGAVQLHRATTGRFALGVPVTVGGHDGEVLLAGILNRISGHARVDAVLLAAIVAAHAGQAFTRGRRASGNLRKQFVEPAGALR